jgi:pimeloyl-ACP methyl ester carboxylesterase
MVFFLSKQRVSFALLLLKPPKKMGLVMGLMIDVVAGVAIDIAAYFGHHKGDHDDAHPDRPAILCIHGSGSTQSQCIIGRQVLKTEFSVFSLNLEGDLAIPDYVPQVIAKMDDIREQTGHVEFYLIGFSMGGLVASLVTLHCPKPYQIRYLCTLCTPFQGVPLLWLWDPRWVKRHTDMIPCSPLILQLRAGLKKLPCPLLSFATTIDWLVPAPYAIPYEPPLRHQHVLYRFPSHLAMSYVPSVFHRIRDTLMVYGGRASPSGQLHSKSSIHEA